MAGRDHRYVNVGCGDIFAPEPWVNVDKCAQLEPDVVASITDLPFGDGTVEWCYAGHVLEHLEWPDEVADALVELKRVLHPGGHLLVVCPDIERARAEGDPATIDGVLLGAHRWPGDEHRWVCSAAILLPVVKAIFPTATEVPIHTVPSGWPIDHRLAWQLAVMT